MSRARDIADLSSVSARLDTVGGSEGALSNRNLVINGGMTIDQRNSGSATTPTSDQTATLDRFKARLNNASKYSVQQVTDAPSGFSNSLKVTSAAATTVGTNDFYQIAAPLEGYTTNVLAQGSSAAKQFTLSFYVKSSLTGTFGGAYSNDLGDRFYAWTYTINSANTWERKSITITGATDGTWVSTNGAGLHIYWTLGAGSGVQTTADVWGTSFKRGPTGATNVVATSGATWQITGVQLEVGDTATDFEHRSFGDELARCQRYYSREEAATGAAYKRYATGSWSSTTGFECLIPLSTPLRTTPTLETTGTASNYAIYSANAVDALTSLAITNDADAGTDNRAVAVAVTTSSGGVSGEGGTLLGNNNTDNFLALDAEL